MKKVTIKIEDNNFNVYDGSNNELKFVMFMPEIGQKVYVVNNDPTKERHFLNNGKRMTIKEIGVAFTAEMGIYYIGKVGVKKLYPYHDLFLTQKDALKKYPDIKEGYFKEKDPKNKIKKTVQQSKLTIEKLNIIESKNPNENAIVFKAFAGDAKILDINVPVEYSGVRMANQGRGSFFNMCFNIPDGDYVLNTAGGPRNPKNRRKLFFNVTNGYITSLR